MYCSNNYKPAVGERVLFVDTNEETHHAIVVDAVPDDEYVTLVWSGEDRKELGEDYHHDVKSESSVYPHKHFGDGSTAETHCFIPVYWEYEGEYDCE